MTLFRNKYRVESTRLPGYDYASPGGYFVTICAGGMKECFGEIKNCTMIPNRCGDIVRRVWKRIPEYFPNAYLDVFQLMPNHIHGIIALTEKHGVHRGDDDPKLNNGFRRDTNIRVSARMDRNAEHGGITGRHNPMLSRTSLSRILRWFKGGASFEIHKLDKGFYRHPRFHDHIIRDEGELIRIREYIHNNPVQWQEDRNQPFNLPRWLE